MKIVIELDEKQKEFLERISMRMGVNYEQVGNQIPLDSLLSMIQDLNGELDNLQQKYRNLMDNIEENYRPKTLKEMYD